MVQLVNPFSLLAEKHVNDLVGAVEAKAESSFPAAEKKKKQDEIKKKKEKQKPPPRPVSSAAKPKSIIPISTSTGGSLKSYNGGQHQQRGPADFVSFSGSNSTNDFDQTQGSENEEAKNTKDADPDAEGWQLVQYQTRKKGPRRSGNQGQTQGAVGKNHVNVEEGIRQLQEVVKGVNGSQGVKPRRPNINGSARRKLQKQKAGVGHDQQFQVKNNAAAAAENVPADQSKSTVSYTLEEFEMMKKKNGGLNIHNELFKAHEDHSYRGQQRQRGGHRSKDKIDDVSQEATVEKADDTLFSLNPGEFPVLRLMPQRQF
ncbi:hypothetical protein M0R45_004068 [Rubus argutus]|uniref:Uncharacterized protein n=1 Tax=Rubus argutus TaxID=59490 RepID=A0AAW1YGZ0_RUBAR